jgi:hypothetical protein
MRTYVRLAVLGSATRESKVSSVPSWRARGEEGLEWEYILELGGVVVERFSRTLFHCAWEGMSIRVAQISDGGAVMRMVDWRDGILFFLLLAFGGAGL